MCIRDRPFVHALGMHKGLLTLIIFQLLTNIALIATLWYKLG